MLSGELVGRVHTLVAPPAERRLVGTAEQRRLRLLAHVTLHLHPQFNEFGLNCSNGWSAGRESVDRGLGEGSETR